MKKLLSFLLSTLIVLTTAPASAIQVGAEAYYKSGYYSYTIQGGSAAIIACDASISGDITIPSELLGYPVTSIGNYAFESCKSLNSVVIPNGVLNIGNSAFYNSGIKSVAIPESIKSIGNEAFLNCRIEKVYIADLKAWCEIDDAVSYLFYSAPELYVNNLPVTELVIPEGITKIGSGAFSYCQSLKSVTIPKSVTSIGNDAFLYSSVTDVIISGGLKSIGYQAFCQCDNLTSISLPDSVTYIGEGAFSGCEKLANITIPNSITRIEYNTFNGCRGIAEVIVPDSVTSIGDCAFLDCYGLENISIPDSVASIGEWAFSEKTTLNVNEDSYAHKYAIEHGLKIYLMYVKAPQPPVIQDNFPTSIVLQKVDGYEYRCNDGLWQTSNTFTNLESNTTYTFYQRIAASDKNQPSDSSKGLTVTTSKLIPPISTTPIAPNVEKIDYNSIALKPTAGYEYRCDNGEWQTSNVFNGLIHNTTYTFYQRVAETDTYAAGQPSPSTTVTTKKKADNTTAVPAPVVLESTSDSITLKPQADCEYSKDGATWQKSNIFTGLVSGKQYTFYQRIAETADVAAGPASIGRKVKLFYVGDLDNDKQITNSDGVLLARYLAGWKVNMSSSSVFDIDGDGEVTDWDGVLLDRYLAGWNIQSFVGTGKAISTYTITYDNLKGAQNKNPSAFNSGDKTAFAALSLKHYTFDGWYNENQKIARLTGKEKTDITLTAKWTPVEYKVTYINSDGKNGVVSKTYTIEDKSVMYLSDNMDKYFAGWYDINGNRVYSLNPDNGDITLTARWEKLEPMTFTTVCESAGGVFASLNGKPRYCGSNQYVIEGYLSVSSSAKVYGEVEILIDGVYYKTFGFECSGTHDQNIPPIGPLSGGHHIIKLVVKIR